MKTLSATLSLLFFLNTITFAQIIFEKSYGELQNSKQSNSIIYHNNAVVLAGYTTHESNGGEDLLLVKLDASGNLIWQKEIGGIKNERGTKIKSVADGYLIAGHTKSIGNGNQDFYFIKTDFDGNLLWERNYGTENLEHCIDFLSTPDGGFLLVGTGIQNITTGEDWWIVKTDEAGNMEWNNYYGTDGIDNPVFVKMLSDDNFIIGGGYKGHQKLLKIDATGNLIWDFGTVGNDFAYTSIIDAIELDNGEIIFTNWQVGPAYAKLSTLGELIYEQSPFSTPPSFDFPLKLQIINQDSIHLFSQSKIISFTADTGDNTGLATWNNFNTFYTNNNDLFIDGNNYYTISPHVDDSIFEIDGFSARTYNQDFELETIYRDTFEFNDYEEYAKKIVETNSGDLIILGNQLLGNSDLFKNILLTKTDANGLFLEEILIDKGNFAEPVDLFYSNEENLILLTQFPEDTLELSMIDTNGLTLWSHIYLESYETNTLEKNVVITPYLDGQYLLSIRGREFYVFDEAGNINSNFISNAPSSGLPLELKVLDDGRILFFTKENMILLNADASWVSTTYLRPGGFDVFEFFDFHYLSEDNIWLVGKARNDINDPASSVIMQVNLEGTRIAETTFSALPYNDLVKLNIVDVDNDRIIVYGNEKSPWPYAESSTSSANNCLIKPLNISFLEDWSIDGQVVNRVELGVGDGAQLSNMIVSSDNNFVGAGWYYNANSDDQYLVKIDRDEFVPTHGLALQRDTDFSIYPNPGNTSLSINFDTEETGNAIIQLFNTTGQIVKIETSKNQSFESPIEINTSDLPEGVYFIQININNKKTSTKKWIKFNS